MHPRVLAATERQLIAWRAELASGARRVGWKLAYDFPEIDAVIGAGEPVLGHLTSATLIEPGGRFDASFADRLRAETEVVVEIGRGGEPAGVAVAIELVDVARPPGGLEGIIAGNVAHRGCVLGPSAAAIPSGAQGRILVDGEVRETASVGVDPPRVVQTVARLLEGVGERLQEGDLVLCGSITHVPVVAGAVVVGEIDGIGRVEVSIG